jgi:hypothetical protein
LDKVTLKVKPESLEQIVSETMNVLSILEDGQLEILKDNQTNIGGLPAREVS